MVFFLPPTPSGKGRALCHLPDLVRPRCHGADPCPGATYFTLAPLGYPSTSHLLCSAHTYPVAPNAVPAPNLPALGGGSVECCLVEVAFNGCWGE